MTSKVSGIVVYAVCCSELMRLNEIINAEVAHLFSCSLRASITDTNPLIRDPDLYELTIKIG